MAGLFAGIGGIELGFHRAGHRTELLCEIMPAAQAVLRKRFLKVDDPPKLVPDVRAVSFPRTTQVITAGFPCTDLSQAGRMAGIGGENSGLIQQVFDQIDRQDKTGSLDALRYLVLENVPNMLRLDRGEGMRYLVRELEARGFHWAYRTVNTQAFGLPQRRRRVLVVASRTHDPRDVLLVDDEEPIVRTDIDGKGVGFYWTEGLRGLGWAVDAVPTLKGGSTLGIPSQPAVWMPDGSIVSLPIEVGERLQGFPRNWTLPAERAGHRPGERWKLVGNAVSVPVSEWLGRRLASPGRYNHSTDTELDPEASWPHAAWSFAGDTRAAGVGEHPVRRPYRQGIAGMIGDRGLPLSLKATLGFYGRLLRSGLNRPDEFDEALEAHILRMGGSPDQIDDLIRAAEATRR